MCDIHTAGQRSNRTRRNYAEALPHIVEADEYRRFPSLKFGYRSGRGEGDIRSTARISFPHRHNW
jgi:hypothetical protein